MINNNIIFFSLFVFFFFGCSPKDKIFESTIPFRSLNSDQTGIDFSNSLEYKTKLNIIEYLYYYNGGGVSVGDINNDGLEDVIIEWSDMKTEDNNSEEDFQIILYQGNNSETGDGEMKIQYKEFNNTSNGYYPEGGTPQHGCYVTIGIENKYANQGLEYTFNNQYSPGAANLSDGTAIFITTTSPIILYGDVNGDEILNVLDVVILVNMVLDGINSNIGDMNQDGILNILDVVILVGIVLGR